MGKVAVHSESGADVSAHCFYKRGTTVMFEIIISNIDVVSYLHMTLEKLLQKAEKYKRYKCLQDYLDSRCSFTPIVYSSYRIPGV